MKALPNDINQLDDFYKDALKDLTIEPDVSVWANIETALNNATPFDSTLSTETTPIKSLATKSILSNLTIIKVATIVALGAIGIGTATYFLMNEKKQIGNANKAIISASVDSMPLPNQEIKKQTDLIEPEKSSVPVDNIVRKNYSNSKLIKVDENTKKTISEDVKSDELENISNTENMNPKSDSIPNDKIIEEEKENKVIKKPKSFYEKYAEKLKDSTRDIFVPMKHKR